jgi:hypothetical protein
MTDEQDANLLRFKARWLAMREKRRRPKSGTELDASITEFEASQSGN